MKELTIDRSNKREYLYFERKICPCMNALKKVLKCDCYYIERWYWLFTVCLLRVGIAERSVLQYLPQYIVNSPMFF